MMRFYDGMIDTSETEQQISALVFMIDTYTNMLKYEPYLLTKISKTPNVIVSINGTSTDQAYLGAVRSGFELLVNNQPEEIKKHVKIHIQNSIESLKSHFNNKKINQKIIDCDIIFGHKDPFNFYYTGLRYSNAFPITNFEAQTE